MKSNHVIKKIIKLYLRQVQRLPSWYRIPFFQKCFFFSIEGYWPNISKPTKIKEVIFINRINTNEEFSKYINKFEVKNIIDKINKEENINIEYAELMQIVNTPMEINFDEISESCFIKGTHGCGMNLLYQPRITNKADIISEATKWINTDYYKLHGEMNYLGVEKKILVEKFLIADEELSIDDIKVHCFRGNPSIIQVLRDVDGILKRKTYDINWIEKQWFKNETLDINLDSLPKDKIINYSRILSKNFDYVRIDFFLIGPQLYFAEFTFTPAGGYIPLLNTDVDKELYNIYKETCK